MRHGSLLLGAILAATLAAPLTAQGNDPTTKVTGSGLPAGWMLRFDPARRGPEPKPTDVNFRAMGNGWHLNSGPAAIYYRTADAQTGDFTVSATISQAKSSNHEAYGIFIGGKDLQTANQNYTYFVIRPVDGRFLINHRSSDGRPTSLVAYGDAPDPAIHADDPSTGAATNTLAIRVAGGMVHFLVNGKEVKVLKASELDGGATDGLVGLRLNHNLDVHIADFGVKK